MIIPVDHENFHQEVYQHDGPVVLTFGFDGCGPCRALKPELDKLNAQYGIKVVKADITDSPELATHFNVTSVPSTFFFSKGEPRLNWTGVAKVDKLKKLVEEAVSAA